MTTSLTCSVTRRPGSVESVGEGVTAIAPGDYVILNWRAVCGDCRACRRGRPWYCFNTYNATQKMTLEDGTELSPALGHRGVHREDPGPFRPVHEGGPGRAGDRCRPARLRRDGRSRCRHQHRRRDPWRLRGRHRLRRRRGRGHRRCCPGRCPHDHRHRHRRAQAGRRRRSSARRTRSTPATGDVVEAVQALTDGFGADVVIDAVGTAATWKQAFYARDLAGTVVLVGVPMPDAHARRSRCSTSSAVADR